MTEEKKETSTPPVDTDKASAGAETKTKPWLKEEQADNTRATQSLAKHTQRAQELGFNDIDALMDKFHTRTLDEYFAETEQGEKSPPDKPSIENKAEQDDEGSKAKTEPDTSGFEKRIADLEGQVEKSARESTSMQMLTMRNQYARDQRSLPEKERSAISLEKIQKFLLDRGNFGVAHLKAAQIQEQTGEYNLFKASADIMGLLQGSDKLKEQGAMERQALIDAQKAATGMDSKAAPPGDDEKDDNAKRADEIAKDDPPYEMS